MAWTYYRLAEPNHAVPPRDDYLLPLLDEEMIRALEDATGGFRIVAKDDSRGIIYDCFLYGNRDSRGHNEVTIWFPGFISIPSTSFLLMEHQFVAPDCIEGFAAMVEGMAADDASEIDVMFAGIERYRGMGRELVPKLREIAKDYFYNDDAPWWEQEIQIIHTYPGHEAWVPVKEMLRLTAQGRLSERSPIMDYWSIVLSEFVPRQIEIDTGDKSRTIDMNGGEWMTFIRAVVDPEEAEFRFSLDGSPRHSYHWLNYVIRMPELVVTEMCISATGREHPNFEQTEVLEEFSYRREAFGKEARFKWEGSRLFLITKGEPDPEQVEAMRKKLETVQ